jgi:hypothetical protein
MTIVEYYTPKLPFCQDFFQESKFENLIFAENTSSFYYFSTYDHFVIPVKFVLEKSEWECRY